MMTLNRSGFASLCGQPDDTVMFGRRAFLRNGTLILGAASLGQGMLRAEPQKPVTTFGLVTDLHYADKPPGGSRHYRATPRKLADASEKFRSEKPDFVVELGDFIDAAESVSTELNWLKHINREFSTSCPDRHYVLGNHCVYTLRKQEFLETVGQKKSYYSFDSGDCHFVVLDACFRSDGMPYGRKNFQWTDPNVPAAELDWLREDLQATSKKTVVFAHQRFDVSNHYGVRNAADVRTVLEESDRVLAVFQGHSHQNDYREIGGIHYCTLVAMVEGEAAESSGYSIGRIDVDGTLHLSGFRKQAGYRWSV